jgi:hypothetical protein
MLPGRLWLDLETIDALKPDLTLEGNQLAKIDDRKPPSKAIEFAARRNRFAAASKFTGQISGLLNGNRRFCPIRFTRSQPALRFTRSILKLLAGNRAEVSPKIKAPARKLPNLKLPLTHNNTSQSHEQKLAITTAP